MTRQSNARPVAAYAFCPDSNGHSTGKHFRESALWPALRRGERVRFDLKGQENVPEAFFDEAFGGLVREHPEVRERLKDRLEIVGPNALVARAWASIDRELRALAREEDTRKEREAILDQLTADAQKWGLGYDSP